MVGRKAMVLLMSVAVVVTAGCDTALVMGNKVVGVESGRFYYTDGFLRTDFSHTLDQVWAASKSTLVEMKALDMQEKRRIAQGPIECTVSDEKVTLELEYGNATLTYVSVRTGKTGNQLASKMILDRIRQKLEASAPAETHQ